MTTRGEFLRRAVVAGATIPLLMGARRRGSRLDTPADGRPNILFILTDDQPAHTLRVMEQTLARFSDGMNLTEKAYVPVPLCGPDRVSLLTGRYPHNHDATGNENSYNLYRKRLYPQDDLLSRLDRAGYRVGFFGKLMNGYGEGDSGKSSYWKRQERADAKRQQYNYEGTTEELEFVDAWVERVFLALEDTGQLENTLVFYATDNGYMMGEHGGMTKKIQPYEESTRTPFLMRGPASTLNPERNGQLVGHLDITRTILGVAGADTSGVDGRDLRASGAWRRRILVEHPEKQWAMLRDGDLVYMDFYGYGTAEEMYDLARDPYQLESVHDDPLYADRKATIIDRLDRMRSAAGGELRALEEAE